MRQLTPHCALTVYEGEGPLQCEGAMPLDLLRKIRMSRIRMASDLKRRGDAALARFRLLSTQRRVLVTQAQYFMQQYQRELAVTRRLVLGLPMRQLDDSDRIRRTVVWK
jgi:hypothetical protein